MEQAEFLENNIFTDLKNLNEAAENESAQQFSESDFEIVLQRVEHFGVALYKIESWLNGDLQEAVSHEDHKKKATDPKWYNKAFMTSKSRQAGQTYSATYKVSNKLLARFNSENE